MRLPAALLAGAFIAGLLAVAPSAAQADPEPVPGYFYMDAAVLADNTEQCTTSSTYVMKPERPVNSAKAYLDEPMDAANCSARFRLYETPGFILPKSDLDFRLYLECTDFVGVVGPGEVPELSIMVHLLNGTGGEQGDGPLQMTMPLFGCGSPSCGSSFDPTELVGTFQDVELGPGESEGLTLVVDALTVGTSSELGRVAILTGPICGYNLPPAPQDMSYLTGQFLPGAAEDLELTTDLVYGKAPKGAEITYGLHLLNNATETGYSFSVVDLPRPFQVTFTPLSGTLGPGESLNATLKVVVAKGALNGSVWPFTIRVDGDGGSNDTVAVELKVIAVETPIEDPGDGGTDTTTAPPPPPPGPSPPSSSTSDETTPPGVTSTGRKTPGFELVALLAVCALAVAIRRRLA